MARSKFILLSILLSLITISVADCPSRVPMDVSIQYKPSHMKDLALYAVSEHNNQTNDQIVLGMLSDAFSLPSESQDEIPYSLYFVAWHVDPLCAMKQCKAVVREKNDGTQSLDSFMCNDLQYPST